MDIFIFIYYSAPIISFEFGFAVGLGLVEAFQRSGR